MNIEDRIAIVKDLIKKREEIDQQLADLFGGQAPTPKKMKCSICGSTEHTARNCPHKSGQKTSQPESETPRSPFDVLSNLNALDEANSSIRCAHAAAATPSLRRSQSLN
jgi:hypothetical protein